MNANDREILFRILPAIIEEYKISADKIGGIMSMIMLATGSLAIWGMAWSDRGGKGWARKYRHLPIIIIYTAFTFFTGFNVLTAGIAGFMILQMIKNAACGIGEAMEVTSVAEWWPKEARGFALGAHHSGYPWGSLLGGILGISFWLAPYLAFVQKFSFSEAAFWSVLFNITGGLGQIFWGSLSDKIGRKVTLLICFGWLAVAFWLFQFVASGLAALIVIQLFAGCATNAVFPILYSLVADSAKKGYNGTAIGICLFGLYLGGVSPFILGWFIEIGGGWNSATGYMSGLYFLVGCMVLSFLLILFFTRETVGAKRGRDFSFVSKESCNISMN